MIEGQEVITGDHSETRGVRRHAHVLSRVVAKVKRLSIITEARNGACGSKEVAVEFVD